MEKEGRMKEKQSEKERDGERDTVSFPVAVRLTWLCSCMCSVIKRDTSTWIKVLFIVCTEIMHCHRDPFPLPLLLPGPLNELLGNAYFALTHSCLCSSLFLSLVLPSSIPYLLQLSKIPLFSCSIYCSAVRVS